MHHGFQLRLASFGLSFALLVGLGLVAAAPARAATVQITEFLAGPARDWDGSGVFSSRDDEWVELRNASGATLDLSGFLVTDGDSLPRFALSGTLGPGERRVVYGRESYDWEKAHGLPAFGLSLGNTGDAVLLWHVDGADTTLVDGYTYHSHEAAADRSVGRASDAGDWILFDGLNPYTGSTAPTGTGCDPTPGAFNVCGATATRKSTWGALKTLYR